MAGAGSPPTPPPASQAGAQARAAAATWTLWGFAVAVLGLANLAVMGFDPVPNQHAVVGIGIPVVMLAAALATQAVWPGASRGLWVLAWAVGTAVSFGSAVLQSALGNAFLYGLGDAGTASQEAPLALWGALFAGGLTIALRRLAWWPGLAATLLLLGLYVWASSWGWGGDSDAAKLFGGAVLNGACLIVFAAAGWCTAWAAARVTASRTRGAAGPARA